MEEKTMMPINNQIEPDFLEHIKSTSLHVLHTHVSYSAFSFRYLQ